MKGVEIDENALSSTEAIIYSMTKKERSNPDILNPSRKKRIAAGAGVNISEVNALVKQFEQSKKMMKQFSGMMGKGGKHGGKFKMPFGF
jgi:signal recognition particle subunit SRP54